jgi:copper homeostasis protein
MMMPLEACIECADLDSVRRSVTNALEGGAERVELCSNLQADGLTPDAQSIRLARSIFAQRKGVLVMIRPRAGDFEYSDNELNIMAQQIAMAADAGADGIVLGALRDRKIDEPGLVRLVAEADHYNLAVTFHRAFDEVSNRNKALELLVSKNIQSVLTCGAPLSSGLSALHSVETINQTITQARDRIEVVIGGGLDCDNISPLLCQLRQASSKISLHSYSGLLKGGLTATHLVRRMVGIINHHFTSV